MSLVHLMVDIEVDKKPGSYQLAVDDEKNVKHISAFTVSLKDFSQ